MSVKAYNVTTDQMVEVTQEQYDRLSELDELGVRLSRIMQIARDAHTDKLSAIVDEIKRVDLRVRGLL